MEASLHRGDWIHVRKFAGSQLRGVLPGPELPWPQPWVQVRPIRQQRLGRKWPRTIYQTYRPRYLQQRDQWQQASRKRVHNLSAFYCGRGSSFRWVFSQVRDNPHSSYTGPKCTCTHLSSQTQGEARIPQGIHCRTLVPSYLHPHNLSLKKHYASSLVIPSHVPWTRWISWEVRKSGILSLSCNRVGRPGIKLSIILSPPVLKRKQTGLLTILKNVISGYDRKWRNLT